MYVEMAHAKTSNRVVQCLQILDVQQYKIPQYVIPQTDVIGQPLSLMLVVGQAHLDVKILKIPLNAIVFLVVDGTVKGLRVQGQVQNLPQAEHVLNLVLQVIVVRGEVWVEMIVLGLLMEPELDVMERLLCQQMKLNVHL